MAKNKEKTTTCPSCGHKQNYTAWSNISSNLNPEIKQQLLDGMLFRVKCENCGQENLVNYDVTYSDIAHNVVLRYTHETEEEKNTPKILAFDGSMMDMEIPGCRKRTVTDQNTLREKAIIFENGLDDRVIEIIKLMYLFDINESYPDANIIDVFFVVKDGKYILEFLGNKMFSTEVPPEVYSGIKSDFAAKLIAEGDSSANIDINWASAFLDK